MGIGLAPIPHHAIEPLYIRKKMKPDSSETSEKIVKSYEQDDTSIRKVAARFDVSKGFVKKI
jgi:transposase-like protein